MIGGAIACVLRRGSESMGFVEVYENRVFVSRARIDNFDKLIAAPPQRLLQCIKRLLQSRTFISLMRHKFSVQPECFQTYFSFFHFSFANCCSKVIVSIAPRFPLCLSFINSMIYWPCSISSSRPRHARAKGIPVVPDQRSLTSLRAPSNKAFRRNA